MSSILIVGSISQFVGWSYCFLMGQATSGLMKNTRKLNAGGYPSGQRGLTVNQLAEAYGGSNPSPPTCTGECIRHLYQSLALVLTGIARQHDKPT